VVRTIGKQRRTAARLTRWPPSGVALLISVSLAVAAVVTIGVLWFKLRATHSLFDVVPAMRTGGLSSEFGQCPPAPPILAAVANRDVELAVASLNQLRLGALKVEENPKIVEVLKQSGRDSLAIDYLVCNATRRGEIRAHNPAQADYLRRFLSFMSTGPTTEQLDRWLRVNTLPQNTDDLSPSSLVTPDFKEDTGFFGLTLESFRGGGTFRVINVGSHKFELWGTFPGDLYTIFPDIGTAREIASSSTESFKVVPQLTGKLFANRRITGFSLETDIPTPDTDPAMRFYPHPRYKMTIDVRFRDIAKVRSELIEALESINANLAAAAARAKPGTSTPLSRLEFISSARAAEVSAAQLSVETLLVAAAVPALTAITHESNSLAQFRLAQVFDELNLHSLSVMSIQRAFELDPSLRSPAAELRSLRAQLLSADRKDVNVINQISQNIRNLLQAGHVLDNTDPLMPESAASPLTEPRVLVAVLGTARAFQANPLLTTLGESLLGDVAFAAGNMNEACDHFVAASVGGINISLALRGTSACLDSGRAGYFIQSIRKLAESSPFWIMDRARIQVDLQASQLRRRSSIVFTGGDIDQIEDIGANWKKTVGLPTQLVASNAEFSCLLGIGEPDIEMVWVSGGASDASSEPAPRCATVPAYAPPLYLGQEVLAFAAPREQIRNEKALLGAMVDVYMSNVRESGLPVPSRWASVIAASYGTAVCEEAERRDNTSGRKCSITRVEDSIGRGALERLGYRIVRIGPQDPLRGDLVPFRGILPSTDTIENQKYKLTIRIWAFVKERQAFVSDAVPRFKQFSESQAARADQNGKIVRW
jgi:hypothetical protein